MDDFVRDIEQDKDLITAGSGHELTQRWDDTMGHKFKGIHDSYKPETAEPYGVKKQ